MKRLFLIAAFVFCSSAFANTLTIGEALVGSGDIGDIDAGSTAQTDIDLGDPATASGTIDTVLFPWRTGSGCTDSVKIKFFRRNGNTLTMFAERGPFTVNANNTITLSPPVAVLQGDLIGITRLARCGSAGRSPIPSSIPGVIYVVYPSDVTGSVDITAGTPVSGYVLDLGGTGTTSASGETLRAIIPVVGSTAGANGANFKTAMQVRSLVGFGSPFSGRLIFHPQGAVGSASDPSLPISVPAQTTVSYDDIVAAMGQTGLGSIDVMAPADAQMPTFAVRVFNDAGANGTSGFIEDVLKDPASSKRNLGPGSYVILITPADVVRTRLNIGVRTLSTGASISIAVYDKNGADVRTATKTYGPNFFQQTDAATFTGGAIAANQSIAITVTSGNVIIYGAQTDNTTNDPAVQFAEPAF